MTSPAARRAGQDLGPRDALRSVAAELRSAPHVAAVFRAWAELVEEQPDLVIEALQLVMSRGLFTIDGVAVQLLCEKALAIACAASEARRLQAEVVCGRPS